MTIGSSLCIATHHRQKQWLNNSYGQARRTGVADAYANWIKARPFAWSSSRLTPEGFPKESRVRVAVGVPSEKLMWDSEPTPPTKKRAVEMRVGIIGAGMSGLYAGLLLKKNGIPFQILEGKSDRVGGRVYTCREEFGEGEFQYFEAGAMRLPCIPSQDPIFHLIECLNKQLEACDKPDKKIELIDYTYKHEEGNLVYMNGKQVKTLKYANEHPKELGFVDLTPEDTKKTADALMGEVMKPLLEEFNDIGEKSFFEKYDHMSLRYYLGNCADPKWYPAKINYVETMTSGTNGFTYGLIENVIAFDNFNSQPVEWKTIKNGMCRLPEACVALIGEENITMGAIAYKIDVEGDKVAVTYSTDGKIPSEQPKVETFGKVLLAIPNSVLRMIERPIWSPRKEEAIRACNIQPCYKLGLQFKTRFWENVKKVDHPTYGGQSTTDTPSRWIVYPSYGIGDKGKGILITYCWSTDALSILPASEEQRKTIALRDLQCLYPNVKVAEEFTGKWKSVHWTTDWTSGVAAFLPGQFKHLYEALQEPEAPIYFAGEHISTRHGWIVGALESARHACHQMFPPPPPDDFPYLC